MIPVDLTQESHFEELPFGTRGGASVHYIFPQDAEYEIQLRLTRDRNEHVEGLTGPTPIELMIDGSLVQSFVVRLAWPFPRARGCCLKPSFSPTRPILIFTAIR
jgi:hypothetical protein